MDYNIIRHYSRSFRYTSPIYKDSKTPAVCGGCESCINADEYFVMCNWDTSDISEVIHLKCLKQWFPEGYWYVGRGQASRLTPEMRAILETPFAPSAEADHTVGYRAWARSNGERSPRFAHFLKERSVGAPVAAAGGSR
jgi:hypothetical protein